MSALTTAQLLSPPEDVARQAEDEILAALSYDQAMGQPVAMAMTRDARAVTAMDFQPVANISMMDARNVQNFQTMGFAAAAAASAEPRSIQAADSDPLGDGLNNAEVKRRAYEDIKTLAGEVRSARASFVTVGNLLHEMGRIQDEQIAREKEQLKLQMIFNHFIRPPVFNPPPFVLPQKWAPIEQNFINALVASIRVAAQAIFAMRDVKDILGSAEGKTVADLKARLLTFRQKLQEEEAKALQLKNQFQSVVDSLRTFWADMDLAFQTPYLAQLRNDLLRTLGQRIGQLTGQLEKLQQRLAALNSVIIRQTTSCGVGAAMMFFQLCPSAFLYWMRIVNGNGSVGDLLMGVEAEMQATQAQMEEVRRQINQTPQQQALLYDPKLYLNNVALKLDTVVSVWQTLNLDMHALSTDLETNVTNPNAPVTKFFVAKLKVSKEFYGNILWLLEQYVEQMIQL